MSVSSQFLQLQRTLPFGLSSPYELILRPVRQFDLWPRHPFCVVNRHQAPIVNEESMQLIRADRDTVGAFTHAKLFIARHTLVKL